MARAIQINPTINGRYVREALPYRDPDRLERLLSDCAAAGMPE